MDVTQVFTEAEVRASLVFQVSKLCSFMLKAARIATGGAAWDALVAGRPLLCVPCLAFVCSDMLKAACMATRGSAWGALVGVCSMYHALQCYSDCVTPHSICTA